MTDSEKTCHILTENDPPPWLKNFMQDCVGKSVISAYSGIGTNAGKAREMFLHVEKLLKSKRPSERQAASHFREALRTILIDKVPVSLSNVIHADDSESKILANRVVQHFQSANASRSVCEMSVNEVFKSLRSSHTHPLQKPGVTMVVAGALVAGRRLAEVNIALRKLRCERVHYLIGVSRSSSSDELNKTKNTVVGGPSQYSRFTSVQEVFIPDNAPCPWDRELVTLRNILKTTINSEASRILERRADILKKAPKNGGLRQLFWNGLTYNAPLRLTPGFRFWKFPYKSASQAEVYFTILATLHHLRSEQAPGPLILSPDSFCRLNDGVIQAALLRSVYNGELDYRSLPSESSQMRAQFFSMFSNHDDPRGEACIEVLLAILERRLQLRDEDLTACIAHLQRALKPGGRLNCIAMLFCEHILKRLGTTH